MDVPLKYFLFSNQCINAIGTFIKVYQCMDSNTRPQGHHQIIGKASYHSMNNTKICEMPDKELKETFKEILWIKAKHSDKK